MNTSDSTIPVIESVVASHRERMRFLPSYLKTPRNVMLFEGLLYTMMEKLSDEYCGGHWEMHHVTNGAFFMSPTDQETYHCSWSGNYYEGDMSAEAAGITATLFALWYLVAKTQDQSLYQLYVQLKDFAYEHKESGHILAAID